MGARPRCLLLSLTLEAESGLRFQVVQITGLIARRIVCHPQLGDWIRRGDRYGLIRFGSRVDLYFPEGVEVSARLGDKTVAGETVLGSLQ